MRPRICFWHGYLLADTGSNIFTREMTRAWRRAGLDVTLLCQDPAAAHTLQDVVIVRPDIGRELPVFVLDTYPDLEARLVTDLSTEQLHAYIEANASAVRDDIDGRGADVILCNHAVMGGPVGRVASAATEIPYAVYVHGSELEYAIARDDRLRDMARDALDHARWVLVGSAHVARRTTELLGTGPYLDRLVTLPPGVDVEMFSPARGSRVELVRILRDPSAAPEGQRDRFPDADAPAKLADIERFVLYFGKLIPQKGVGVLLDAWRRIEARHPGLSLVIVGFGEQRGELEARAAGGRVVFTGAMSHEELAHLVPLADAVVVPSVLAEAFGMVAAEAAACGVLSVVAGHSGLAEVAAALGPAGFTFDGSVEDLARVLGEVLSLPADEARDLRAVARRRAVDLWSWDAVAGRFAELVAGGRSAP